MIGEDQGAIDGPHGCFEIIPYSSLYFILIMNYTFV